MNKTEEAALSLATNPVDGTPVHPDKLAVIKVGLSLYEVALAIRSLQNLSRADATEYLAQPMKQVAYQLNRQLERAALPAIERKPSVIQTAHDPAADFIRAANSEEGANIHVKQFEDQSPQTKFDGRYGGL